MGQTLTHGIYLPDEGERNCYSGLAGNWQLLDGAVGTIAEHTTALAGKAPLVHTHTKADITDFPALANVATSGSYNDLNNIPASFTPASHTHGNLTNDGKVGTTANVPLITGTDGVVQAGSFGNSANTFCEGNDSRLSDARTPLSHTHTKSDITDFPAYGNAAGTICEGNDSRLSDARTPVAHTHGKADITDLFNSANTWSRLNTYSSNINLYNSDNTQDTPTLYLRNSKVTVSSSGNTAGFQGIYFNDSNNATLAYIRGAVQSNGCVINLKTFAKDSSNNTVENGIQIDSFTDGSKWVAPSENGTINLGGISYKWKTFNGINPGALSIFNPSATQDPIDIPNTWVTDGSAWNTLNVSNMGDGWICLTYRPCGANDYILVRFGGANANVYPSMIFPATLLHDSKYYLYLLVPVAKAMGKIYLEIKLDSNAALIKHDFIPAYGTV